MSEQPSKDTIWDADKVPFQEKFYYAFAQLPGTFYGAVMGLIQAFWYSWMGLRAEFIVIAVIFYGIWNMFNDPLFGIIEDRTRYENKKTGEIQRYMPYIKFGAPIFSLAFALVFLPPGTWRGGQSFEIQIWMFTWYLATLMLYDTMFTIVLIAHVALLPQMTLNQEDRTQVQLLMTLFSVPALVIGMLLPVALLTNPTEESVLTFQILVICIAIFGVFPYWLLVRKVKEHSEYIPENKTSFIDSMKIAFNNKSFIIYGVYDAVSVFILNMLVIALPFYIAWLLNPLGINMLLFLLAPMSCLIISFFIITKLAEKISVKAALSYYLGVLTIGFFFTFFAGIIGNLFLIMVGWCIIMLAFSGDFILHNVMRGDTIDWDEYKTGKRREAVYAGTGAIFSKPMISVALALGPLIMTVFGLVYLKSKDGLYPTSGLEMAALGVNIIFALVPGIAALIGFLIWIKFYPLNKDIIEEMKKTLLKKHEEEAFKHRCYTSLKNDTKME
ncbi:MAG: MFS transporter [Promethearchaeota archaeon]